MIINGIDYFVGLYVMGDDGFPEEVAYFENFQALNAFIREHADDPKFKNNQMCYSFVENIDGEPDGFSWTENIAWQEFSDEQIQDEIDDFIEFSEEIIEHSTAVDEYSREIHYRGEDVDYQKKRSHYDDIAYVCPNCLREVADCRCATYPWYLVQIDKLLVPIIRELNSKGYKTTGCCAGHLKDEEFKHVGVYIAFDQDYDFDEPFPEGGKYGKTKHVLSYIPTEEDYADLAGFQKQVISDLEDWAEMLFENE